MTRAREHIWFVQGNFSVGLVANLHTNRKLSLF